MKNKKQGIFLLMVTAIFFAGAVFANGSREKQTGNVTTVTWYASRPVGGAIDLTMREIAKQYSAEHAGEWKLEIETTADRPSYLQKLKTLIAAGNMPDIIDIDADPYCRQLVEANMLVDVKKFLKDNAVYDDFQETALRYQEFTDGAMYTLPLEYHIEMIWYNKEIFSRYGLTVPGTMNDWLAACQLLKKNGITPLSVDGVDRWPVLRYMAMIPFRDCNNEYIINLRDGKASLGDPEGVKALDFMQKMGSYFNEGFAATDYATAQSMFLTGKSAMYYIGDWEQGAMSDLYDQGKVDYFLLPMVPGAATKVNEYCANSGIGMAFNSETFDAKTKDFILYVIKNYGRLYAARMQMSPLKGDLPSDVSYTALYKRIKKDMDNFGYYFMKPWDTYLDPATNTVLGDNLLLVASGDMDKKTFIGLVDKSIQENHN